MRKLQALARWLDSSVAIALKVRRRLWCRCHPRVLQARLIELRSDYCEQLYRNSGATRVSQRD